jgi:hypothetical protein
MVSNVPEEPTGATANIEDALRRASLTRDGFHHRVVDSIDVALDMGLLVGIGPAAEVFDVPYLVLARHGRLKLSSPPPSM